MVNMYEITEGCNIEIMGYPFYVDNVSPNESFRRREYNVNNLVGGTAIITKGTYVGLDFSVTAHVYVPEDRPDIHNEIFQEMMSKPVEVISPEIGGKFNAMVVIKTEHVKLNSLELTISIKEIPDKESLIPGESFTVPASKKVTKKKTNKKDPNDTKQASDKDLENIKKEQDEKNKKKSTKSKTKKKTTSKKKKGG